MALKDTNEYDALFLEELTVAELVKRLAICVGLQVKKTLTGSYPEDTVSVIGGVVWKLR